MNIHYADQKGNALISCPYCGRKKGGNVSKYIGRELTIRCTCGQRFKCRFEYERMGTEDKDAALKADQSYHQFESAATKDAVPKQVECFSIRNGEASDTEIRVLYLFGKNGTANIVCEKCGFTQLADPKDDPVLRRPFWFRCKCGNVFPCRIEQRQYYRKRVQLQGTYINHRTRLKNSMLINNLSFSGIGFTVLKGQDTIKQGDIMDVSFTLDDGRATEINRSIQVKTVRDRQIGCEFLEKPFYDKELGYYLLT
ncbi:MAG: PilZ domain-containing protein [Thermodesulfobacteriota bacterium]